jgi:hypothetical protein
LKRANPPHPLYTVHFSLSTPWRHTREKYYISTHYRPGHVMEVTG